MKKCKLTRSTIFSYMFVRFFRIFTHRRITFDKNKKSKNKRVTFGNSGTKIKTDQYREGPRSYTFLKFHQN